MIRNFLIKFFIVAALIFLPCCVTKYLWGDKSYQEKITQFLIGDDGRYVVLISQDYHYIFTDNSRVLRNFLSLKQQRILTIDPKKTNLKVDAKNDIGGELVISGPFSILPIEDIAALQAMGFRPDRHDHLEIRVKLSGRRYVARYLGANLPNLNLPPIPIYYSEDVSLVKGVGKAAITPIAVTLDAALLIGKAVVYSFSL